MHEGADVASLEEKHVDALAEHDYHAYGRNKSKFLFTLKILIITNVIFKFF